MSEQAAGLRARGHDVTRLEAFVDAAFAFSLTMLVISANGIPVSYTHLYVYKRQALGPGPV